MTEILFQGHKCDYLIVYYGDGSKEVKYDSKKKYQEEGKLITRMIFQGNSNVLIRDWFLANETALTSEVEFGLKRIKVRYQEAEQLEIVANNKKRQEAINKKAAEDVAKEKKMLSPSQQPIA